MQSLSSSSDPPNRSNAYKQPQPQTIRSYDPSGPSSPKKAPQPIAAPRHGANGGRRRANSSGEALPHDPPDPTPSVRARRAITPNPAQAAREASLTNSGSDVDSLADDANRGAQPLVRDGNDGNQVSPSGTQSEEDASGVSHGHEKANGLQPTFGDGANGNGVAAEVKGPKVPPKKAPKPIRSGSAKSKSTKVGLWLSPKKKAK